MAITKLVADSLGAGATPNQSAFKNIIINGDMSIDQRNSGSAVTTSSDYTLDRFKFQEGGSGGQVISVQQVSDAPAGFEKSAKLTTTTASSSITADAYNMFWQAIEGGNFSNANWGSSDAVQVTLSFWVKASIAGNYTVSVRSSNNGLSYVTPYTISSADTWEKKSLTIAAPTSGTFNVDNSKAIQVSFNHSMGSNYTSSGNSAWQGESKLGATGTQVALTNTVNSTWQITGVQLEIGTSASEFEFLPYDVNLNRCLRYYNEINVTNNGSTFINGALDGNNGTAICAYTFPFVMRSAPTASYSGTFDIYVGGSLTQKTDLNIQSGTRGFRVLSNGVTGTSGQAVQIDIGSGDRVLLSAEL